MTTGVKGFAHLYLWLPLARYGTRSSTRLMIYEIIKYAVVVIYFKTKCDPITSLDTVGSYKNLVPQPCATFAYYFTKDSTVVLGMDRQSSQPGVCT